MGPKKRKRDSSETSGATNVPTHCVIHFPDSSEQGFTPLTEVRLKTKGHLQNETCPASRFKATYVRNL